MCENIKMYKIDKRRKPRKKDTYHRILCIVKACEEDFHVDSEFLEISEEKYNDYFKQCIELGLIRQIKEGPYLAENFNTTIEGYKFSHKSKSSLSAELKVKLGIVEVNIKYERTN